MKVEEINVDERTKCKKVVEAFEELFELQDDMIVADAGKHGIVLLRYFNGESYESNEMFLDSQKLFEELWTEWYEYHLLTPVLGTAASDLDYEELYQILPVEKRQEFIRKKQEFWDASFEK